MTKIEEIIEKVNDEHDGMYAGKPSVKVIHQYMKEYAEIYARKVLEIAAEESKTKWEYVGDGSKTN